MNSRGALLMSQKEIDRYDVIKQTSEGILKQSKAAKRLNLSVRQVIRLCKRYRRDQAEGLIHKGRGRASNRKIKDEIQSEIKELAGTIYSGFGPTFMAEKLLERNQIKIGKEALRQLLIEGGFWKPKREKIKAIHQQRERRASFGELIQIDGSPHDWFEGRRPKCCLIVFIDDATSEILYAHFEKTESMRGYFRGLSYTIKTHGLPLGFYSDRHGIFRVNTGNDPEAQTQFGRACEQLNIELINARTPQAKGRVERANKTLQDRLTKELRLEKINDMETANKYITEKYLEKHNKRFGKIARSKEKAFVPNTRTPEEISEILSEQYTRKLSKNLELSFKNKTYQIQNEGKGRRLQQARIKVCKTLDNEIHLLYKRRQLEYKVIEKNEKRPSIVDEKSLNAVYDQKLNSRKIVKPNKSHPWKTPITKGGYATMHSIAQSVAQ